MKQKLFNKNIVLILASVMVLISGCANKEIVVENGYSNNAKKVLQQSDVKKLDQTIDQTLVKEKDSYVNKVQSTIDSETITLDSVHFDFDKFIVSKNMKKTINNNYKLIDKTIARYQNTKLKLEGNCDEWGTDEYNYALGLKRAKTIKDALVYKGISKDKIVLVSFGESNPVCTDKTELCWKKNRRVDHRLLP